MTLYLFTASYPFGTIESFLEEEIPVLAKQFEKIEIIPLAASGRQTRITPKNCVVHRPIIDSAKKSLSISKYFNNRFNLAFWKEFFQRKVFVNKRRLRTWLIAYRNSCMISKSPIIKEIEKRLKREDICYYYWGKGCNVLSLIWSDKAHHVSRFHGEWDLWEESSGDYAPLRTELSKCLDLAVFIASRGETYFKDRYPYCLTRVSRLGAKDAGVAKKSSDGVLRVVSCSSVYPLKRVPLIHSALAKMTHRNIEWTHIGDGADFEELQKKVERDCFEHLKVNLIGRVPHEEVITFYQNNAVDVFINMSTNEGIPVSIMEAASFDIPVVATNVGGTPEIVSSEVGVLLSANPSEEDIVEAIESVYNGNYTPRSFWNRVYNSQKNYTEFCNILKSL